MRVLALSNSSQVGGGNRSLLLLGRSLTERGNSARFVVPHDGPMAVACREEDVEFEFHPIDQPSFRRLDLAWQDYRSWRRVLNVAQAQIVHANDVMTARSVALAARRAKVPVVCHVRFPVGSEAAEWVFRRLPKPSAFIFNSHALQAECGPDFERACPASKQFVVHNAVDLQEFYPRPKQSERTRVGILANLIPIKGQRDFLQMARLLADRGVQSEYWLIGEDIHETGYRAELEQLRCDLGLCESVQFLGHRSDVPELLSELDVVVCASHVEPFGRCLIEAMACEKPVVATRVGGIPEVVADGKTGILVATKSPQQLADAVEKLLRDPQLRQAMGKAGRERVERLFSAEAHVDQILDVYREVLQN